MKAIATAALMAAAVLGGCVTDQAPVAPAAAAPPPPPPPPPRPEMVWTKPGYTEDEFQRTKARCMLRQLEAENANPNGWAWIPMFNLCMRENGWVLVPKANPQQARQAASPKPATRLQVDPD